MANENVKELMESAFRGLDGFVNTKTVVGEPVQIGDATLVPLIEVSCGMASGGFLQNRDRKNRTASAAAMSSKITPSAMLIIQNGRSKLIHVKSQDAVEKLLELLPELLDRFTGGSQVSKSAEKKAEDLMKGAEPEITIEELD